MRAATKTERAFLDWLHTRPCLVAGRGSECFGRVTVHHLMRMGERRDHRRAIPLCVGHHERDYGMDSFERLRWRGFERRFRLDLEREIRRFNDEFERRSDG